MIKDFNDMHEVTLREGYLKALEDIQQEINGIPALYNTISIALVNGLIEKLKGNNNAK